MEIPSPAAGVVRSLSLKLGDKVSQGAPVLVLTSSEAGAPASAAAPAAQPPAPAPKTEAAPAAAIPRAEPVPVGPREATQSKPHASPSVRKFARELGADLSNIRGSGPKGRILREDVQGFVKGVLAKGAAAPAPSAPQ